MIVAYKGIDKTGKRIKGKLEVASLEEAKSRLKANHILYESLSQSSASFTGLKLQRRYPISAADLARLSRELATYIRSGITIVDALKVVQTHYAGHKKLALFLASLNTHIDEGKNFYTALEQQTVVKLPAFFKQSIRVSESSGILDQVLYELSRFLKEQDRIVKEVRNAFSYPAFMLVLSLVMVGFMLTFVVPQITNIFVDMHQELPMVTRFVIASGDFFREYYLMIIIFIIAMAAGIVGMRRWSQSFRYATDALLLRLPLFGAIRMRSELGRFAYVGALLVRSGVPFVQTIDLSANVLDNAVLSRLFSRAATKVVEGKRLSTALQEEPIKIDNSFIQAVGIGEETSQIEKVLSNVSELYIEENRDSIRFMLSLLEPILMLLVGGLIGFIVAAMLLPIFSMSIQ
jgi:type II secretory pathway component PulF